MAILIGGILGLFSIAVLLYPFLKATRTGWETKPSKNSDQPPQELESVYQAIRTLQLEHQLGRIPDSSYQEQLNAYRLEAAEILRSQALAQAGTPAPANDAEPSPGVSGESAEAALEEEILLALAGMTGSPVTQKDSDSETLA